MTMFERKLVNLIIKARMMMVMFTDLAGVLALFPTSTQHVHRDAGVLG